MSLTDQTELTQTAHVPTGAPRDAKAHGFARAENLRDLSNEELLALFVASDPPQSVRAVENDPAGVGLGMSILAGGLFDRWLRRYTCSERFIWHGKSFHSNSDLEGWGYNRFGIGPVLGGFPFRVYFGPSLIDERPSLLLDFDVPRNPWVERLTWDELREVSPGIMLGATGLRIGGRYRHLAWFAVDANRQTPVTGV